MSFETQIELTLALEFRSAESNNNNNNKDNNKGSLTRF